MLNSNSKIAIAGVGGIGSHFLHHFISFGIDRGQYPIGAWDIHVFDDDIVDEKNLLHQNFVQEDLGRDKAEVLCEKTLGVANPHIRFMDQDDFKEFDMIFCCVDNMAFRKALYEYSWTQKEKPLNWVDGRCTSRQGAVFNHTVDRAVLEKFINDNTERGGCLLEAEKAENVSHALPIIISGMMLQTFLNLYRGERCKETILMI